MSIADDLALDIWQNADFQEQFASLVEANLYRQFEGRQTADKAHGTLSVYKLLESALVFASTDEREFQDAAQRISTSIRQLFGEEERVGDLFALIQARLRNFPALIRNGQMPQTPATFPLSLQFEFASDRRAQSIELADGEHLLTEFQRDVWSKLNAKRSATLSAPTSAGKSYVILLYILNQLKELEGSTVVYLVPTRALINQVAEDISAHLKRWNMDDAAVAAIPVDITELHRRAVYVLTQERLDALLVSSPDLKIDIVVVDEAQTIRRGSRGVLLEAVLDRVLHANPSAQVIFSGPLINNPGYFGDLFGLPSFADSRTTKSPITQNTIFLQYSDKPRPSVSVSTSVLSERRDITTVDLPFGLATDADKISYLSVQFGTEGSSIIYSAGRAEAEAIAIKIADQVESEHRGALGELIAFVRRHVHEDYALVGTLEKGVGFHYGFMPPLLRRELERNFKERRISFLVCTSTLLYGLNLPARNIFLLKPKTGRDTSISGPDFWNLAGRVGRLGYEPEGNVFVIDYDTWGTNPIAESHGLDVESALGAAISDRVDELLKYVWDEDAAAGTSSEFETVLGKLLIDQKQGRLERTLSRYTTYRNEAQVRAIARRVAEISSDLDIPYEILNKSMGVSPFRQVDLLKYFVKRLSTLQASELVPSHPLTDFSLALNNYRRAFRRIHTYLLKYPSSDKRHTFFSGLALRWMRGDALPQLINSAIAYSAKTKQSRSTAAIIRQTMENIEEDLRFKYVKYFTCYNALLELALTRTRHEEYVASIPNIPLFLEMGASSGSMINLMGLGLSRTTAEALNEYVTNKDMGLDDARQWLRRQRFEQFDISPVCIREINALLGRAS